MISSLFDLKYLWNCGPYLYVSFETRIICFPNKVVHNLDFERKTINKNGLKERK